MGRVSSVVSLSSEDWEPVATRSGERGQVFEDLEEESMEGIREEREIKEGRTAGNGAVVVIFGD